MNSKEQSEKGKDKDIVSMEIKTKNPRTNETNNTVTIRNTGKNEEKQT